MKHVFTRILPIAICVITLASTSDVVAEAQRPAPGTPASDEVDDVAIAAGDGPQQHIIVFREAPLATYRGERGGPAVPPRVPGTGRVDVHSPAARAYVADLANRQRGHERDLAARVGHSLEVGRRMQHALNATVADLTPSEAEAVNDSPDVLLVEPYREQAIETDAGPHQIGAPKVWDDGSGLPPGQQTDPSGPTQGEGIVFGIFDTGINFGSPSFAAVDSRGYQHVNPLGAGSYLGTCAPGGVDEGRCNDKLIGGYDFVCGPPADACGVDHLREEPGFGDTNGHGSHVASTAAGNHRDAVYRGAPMQLAGVAPRANIVAFDICFTIATTGQGYCPNVSAVAAVDQAIADGVVDVINFSISGGFAPWTDAVSLAFLNATEAGIYVAASAGNAGPGAGTLDHNEPWVGSTAAATHTRAGFESFLTVTGPDPVPPALTSIRVHPGIGGVPLESPIPDSTPLVVSPGIDTPDDACAPLPSGLFAGAIAVVRRGVCTFSDKVNNAHAAGAIAVVIANHLPGDFEPRVPGTSVPAFMVGQADGNAVIDFAAANPGRTTAGIGPAQVVPGTPDVLGFFSSRGPVNFDVLKPDVTAPGVNILATVAGPTITGFEQAVGLLSGTSMASPHHAGAAGLLRQLHPSWSVPEIKSALVMTADQDVLLEDGLTPANPLARGGGRIDAFQAARAGLVLNETAANYLAADPTNGGDPAGLNQPSLTRRDCSANCTFTRTVRNVRNRSQAWVATLEGVPGSVTPSAFTVKAGSTQALEIAIDSSGLPADGSWQFGTVVLRPQNADSDNASPTLRLPVAVSAPGQQPTPLQNDVPVTGLSAAAGTDQIFTLEVPAGATSLTVTTAGGSGELDLFVRAGDRPTGTLYDCPSTLPGSDETCFFVSPRPGTWWIRLHAESTYADVTLTATYTT